jgi:hypothetical protein
MANAPSIPESLLGLPTTDGLVTTSLANLDGSCTWERGDDSCWWVSKAGGMAVSVDLDTDRIDTVFCFAEGVEGHEQYQGVMPRGISFGWTRAQVRSHVGPPDDHSSDGNDVWLDEDHRLVVDYDDQDRVRLVTVTCA